MVKNKKFYRWEVAADYPFPYHEFKERRIASQVLSTDGTFKSASVTIIRGLVKAAVALANAEAGSLPTGGASHIQIGTGTDDKGAEVIYTEYEEIMHPNLIECVAYTPSTGGVKGCV